VSYFPHTKHSHSLFQTPVFQIIGGGSLFTNHIVTTILIFMYDSMHTNTLKSQY